MNTHLKVFLITTVLAVSGATAHAIVRPHSKTIVVESPVNLPVLAQADAEAMYLHDTTDGSTLLYIEAENGQQLTTLDVTDPARIQRVAQTTIPANSAFEFVKPVGDDDALIQYRNGSGAALLSFRHHKAPVLVNSSALEGTSEALGQTALLVTSNEATVHPFKDPRNYKVVDTSNQSQPGLLATIPEVEQRLSKSDTGTVFLLNKDGVTVVRRLRVEEQHQIELEQEAHN
ncbi:MAG: hypothetical protein QOJ51_6961 [Acidobacteriaceae bacterium]|jgi:hypothetical protein|nr:hypothetical protein [Acidobacteriaceae bacterium]MDX6460930.1 hypothetical protein [Acidobacteriaceae bacterium]MEA2264136.1 hypothetical protein [Acidobacteriaceae bacterium]